MRVLFLGDIVGRNARKTVLSKMPNLQKKNYIDFTVVNVENAADGRGVTPKIADEFLSKGVDVLTTGNHVWDKSEIINYISKETRLIRPINMPEGTPGYGKKEVILDDGRKILVINAMTNLFMPKNKSVFHALESALINISLGDDYSAIILDLHGEATSEKMAVGHYFDGKISMIVGTHTHVPTADYQILPNGTAYQTDIGMCGDYDSVIGMEKKGAIARFFSKKSYLKVAKGEITICGSIVEIDDKTGKAFKILPVRLGGRLSATID